MHLDRKDPVTSTIAAIARICAATVLALVAMAAPLAAERPDIVGELFRMFVESKRRAAPTGSIDFLPMGIDALRPALEAMAGFAWRQRIIPRRLCVDDLFDATAHALSA